MNYRWQRHNLFHRRFNLKIHPGHIIPQNSHFFTILVNFIILVIVLFFIYLDLVICTLFCYFIFFIFIWIYSYSYFIFEFQASPKFLQYNITQNVCISILIYLIIKIKVVEQMVYTFFKMYIIIWKRNVLSNHETVTMLLKWSNVFWFWGQIWPRGLVQVIIQECEWLCYVMWLLDLCCVS